MKKGQKKSEIIAPRERLLLFIENTKEYAIIVLDLQGRVEDWNKGARHLLGYLEKEIVGKNFARFFTQEDRAGNRPQRELEKAKQEGKADDENWLVRKDGSKFWASGLTTVVLDRVGNHVGYVKIIRDLTDRQELEKQKDDFISIASHELRTPLTVAQVHRQILEKYLKENHDTHALALFTKISNTMEQLDHLTRDLLNVTKIQSATGQVEKEVFPLYPLVKEVVSEVQKTTKKHTIFIKGISYKKIKGNKAQIAEVLTNLLTNAIKYSPRAEKVTVTLRDNKKTVEVSVQDFGIGIDKPSLSKVFDRFYRTSRSRAKNLPGLGLGLYITKKIIENHNGVIGVTSKEGKGSLFYFRLPIEIDKES